MSSHHNRRRRKSDRTPTLAEPPLLVERLAKVEQGNEDSGASRLSYEEANWAKLSPMFRATHNRLRQARGLPTLPPPKIDLYVAPKAPIIRPFDPTDKEAIVAIANAKFFDGGGMIMGGGTEGFTIGGRKVKL